MKKHLAIWSPRPDAETFTALTDDISIYGLPLMTIAPKPLSDDELALLAAADTLLFTSRYAVAHSVTQHPKPFFANKTLIAIGQRTAAALAAHHLPVHFTAPPPFTSEALLADTHFRALKIQRLALVCGVGGRKHLQTQLNKRCKSVARIECYQRDKANVSPKVMVEFLSKREVSGIIVSSGEIADIVAHTLGIIGSKNSDKWTFFAFSERIATRLRRQGFSRIQVASSASQFTLNQHIINWWEGQ